MQQSGLAFEEGGCVVLHVERGHQSFFEFAACDAVGDGVGGDFLFHLQAFLEESFAVLHGLQHQFLQGFFLCLVLLGGDEVIVFCLLHTNGTGHAVEDGDAHRDAEVGTEVVLHLVGEVVVAALVQFLIIRGGDATEDADGGEERAPRYFAVHPRHLLVHLRLAQGGVAVEGDAEHVVGVVCREPHLFDDGRIYQPGVEHEGIRYGIVHRLLQGEHRRLIEVALMGQVVGIGGLLGFHLCHVRHAFQSQRFLAAGLVN